MNYNVQVADFTPGIMALTSGISKRANFQKLKERELKKTEDENRAREEGAKVFRAGDVDKITDFMIKNPFIKDDFDKAFKWKSEVTKQNAIESARRVIMGEKPQDVLAERVGVIMDEGGDPSGTIELAGRVAENEEEAMREAKMTLAIYAPEELKALQSLEPEKETMTSSHKNYRLAKSEGFTGDFMDFKAVFSGQGAKNELEMMKLKTQILDIQDRMQGRAQKKQDVKKLANRKTKSLLNSVDSILDETGKAILQTKNSWSATGVPGAITSKVPGSPSYNLRKRVGTIQANLGFDKLQEMRDNSPTGGALGQVSERELGFLQSTITALDPNMGDEALVEGLEKITKHYENWRQTVLGEMPESDLPQGVTEEDIEETMRANSLTREQVLQRLGGS